MSTNFALSTNSPYQNVIQSLNYALANINATLYANANVQLGGNVLVVNSNGAITSGNAGLISYVYGYIDVAYADSATGSGFSSNSTGKSYYGVHNSQTPVYDLSPADYQWTQVVGGFGTSKFLFYATGGGGTITFSAASAAPSPFYQPVIDSTPILLAEITANLVTGNSIQGNTVTGWNIAGNTVTSYNIQANTITANNIAAGTITADKLAANVLSVGNVISFGATIEVPSGPGYWLDYTNGNVYFGGNTSIGANLYVAGLINGSSIINNVITTNNMVENSITNNNTVSGNADTELIQYINGNTQTYGAPGYLWPYNTRGIPVGLSGATIITSSNGSSTGSRVAVNYNVYLNTYPENPAYNVVELWKNTSNSTFSQTFENVLFLSGGGSSATGAVDLNEFFTSGLNANALGTNTSVTVTSSTGKQVYAVTGGSYAVGYQTKEYGASFTTPLSGGGSSSPPITALGATSVNYYTALAGNPVTPTVVVGAGGTILRSGGSSLLVIPTDAGTFETSGTLNNLNAVASSKSPTRYYTGIGSGTLPDTSTTLVAVGDNGTILYNTRSYYTTGANVGSVIGSTTWNTETSGTTAHLNDVACNWTEPAYQATTSAGSLWIAVGNGGTVLTSTNGTTWTSLNIGATQNLYGVSWSPWTLPGNPEPYGVWCIVGANGTMYMSNNPTSAISWAKMPNPADGSGGFGIRDLYSVSGKRNSTYGFVAVGQGCIISTGTSSTYAPTWTTLNSSAPLNTSADTRLQYYGSFANVANVSLPPPQQRIANGTVISSTYNDVNYTAGQQITYYLIVGNMLGNANVYTAGSTLNITEYKR